LFALFGEVEGWGDSGVVVGIKRKLVISVFSELSRAASFTFNRGKWAASI